MLAQTGGFVVFLLFISSVGGWHWWFGGGGGLLSEWILCTEQIQQQKSECINFTVKVNLRMLASHFVVFILKTQTRLCDRLIHFLYRRLWCFHWEVQDYLAIEKQCTTDSDEQAELLLETSLLVSEPFQVERHALLNYSQGINTKSLDGM
jgi:hypothetical protein